MLLEPGFWESLWADWSPGYDPGEDVAELRRHVTADNIANVIAPYRASFNPAFADPDAKAEALATLQDPPVPTLYLHGADDGALGVDIFGIRLNTYRLRGRRSKSSRAQGISCTWSIPS